ncbi:transmembrane protein 116 [Aplochiton taeniatus]
MLASGSIILNAALRGLLLCAEVQPLVLLSISDLLLALGRLTGALLFTLERHGHTHCYNLQTLQQMLSMLSWFFMLHHVWALYCGLRGRFLCRLDRPHSQYAATGSSFCKMAALVCGLLPVLLMMPVFIAGNSGRCQGNISQPYHCLLLNTGAVFVTFDPSDVGEVTVCSLVHNFSSTVFLGSFLVTMAGILVLLGKARHFHRRWLTSSGYLGDRQWASLRVVDRRMFLYPSVLLFCWGPAVLLVAVGLIQPRAVQGLLGVSLFIAQAFTLSSQGLVNSVLYGWTQHHFLWAGPMARRDVNTQTPLLQSQKRLYGSRRARP